MDNPVGTDGDTMSESPPQSLAHLLPQVREIATALGDDLQRAEAATRHWTDAAATDELAQTALRQALDRLAATGCWGEANRLPSGELWRIAGRWLEVGWLQRQARFKPHGYAGDYEMLETICSGDLCPHPLGRAFDRFFQSQAAPQAVRNRTTLIAAAIVDCVRRRAATVRVVSVGSGPAVDVRQAVRELTPAERLRLHVTLLDLDPAGLEHARAHLVPLLADEQLDCRRENLSRLARPGRAADALAAVDLLVCSGLFDYLDADAAAALLARFWEALRSEGQALVFNFGGGNPSRAYMEWVGNWYLTYRTAAEMRELAGRAAIPEPAVAVRAEPSGVNLHWAVVKK
jgi:extracellular factor (EF) 3-hydroxypalmitic acid methyl ester biosynthesis protein